MFWTALGCLCELNPQNLKKKLSSGISISISVRFKTSLSRFLFFFFFFFSSLSPLNPQRRRRANVVGHLRREAAPAVGKVGHGDAAPRATRWREKFFFFGHVVRSRCGARARALLEIDVEITTLEPHPECKNCKNVLNYVIVCAAKPLEIQIWQIFNDNNQN